MEIIKIKAPAKVNLTLEVLNKRPDGFHNIQSIMQTISLYDYITINLNRNFSGNEINLSGTSDAIPYDETNLVYKAAKLFFKTADINNYKTDIFIEKNIPIAAGLAGGSTDAAATLFGLDELYGKIYDETKLHELCSQLGSDLNVCLKGGCTLATGRGEQIENLPVSDNKISLIKPKNLGISAKEAYTKYSQKPLKTEKTKTQEMINALKTGKDISEFLYNDLEYAVFDDYEELQTIKNKYPKSIMTGSGSTYFVLNEIIKETDENYDIFNDLSFASNGVCKVLD